MGEIFRYQPHKLIVAALISSERDAGSVREIVHEAFGDTDDELPARPFTFSRYYDKEMGDGILRALYSIDGLVDPETLAGLKERSNRLERAWARPDGSRTLNLDPGLLSLSRVILATTKASAHRVPLRDGLHAEITLLYRHGAYRALEWTYPDFQSEAFVSWLARVRRRYHEQLRGIDPSRPWRL